MGFILSMGILDEMAEKNQGEFTTGTAILRRLQNPHYWRRLKGMLDKHLSEKKQVNINPKLIQEDWFPDLQTFVFCFFFP